MEAPKKDAEGRRLPTSERGRAKKRLMSLRAVAALDAWLDPAAQVAAE